MAEGLAALPEDMRREFLSSLTKDQLEELEHQWPFWAREEQLPPPGDWWFVWLFLGARGSGKSKSGAEYVRDCVKQGYGNIGLIGPTASDVRNVVVEGPSGILSCAWERDKDYKGNLIGRPIYEPGNRRLTWENGAIATTFSAEEPDRLRGPNHDLIAMDEFAAYYDPQAVWDMAMLGLRLGKKPRVIVTTTPRPLPIIKDLVSRDGKDVAVTKSNTYANKANLAPSFIHQIITKYEGTRLGRQELHAEILDDVPGALWTRAILDACRKKPDEKLPNFVRIVVGVDPSGTAGDDGHDDIGIVVVGKGEDGKAYVLEDMTCSLSPAGWANKVIYAYRKYEADCIVAEVNFGGAMVESNIRTIDQFVPIRQVRASRAKVVRAQPIAALYESGKVVHAGALGALEDQLCLFTGNGYMGDRSPDASDAMIWAVTDVMIDTPDESLVGLFKRPWFRLWPQDKPLPEFSYIVLSVRSSYDDERKAKTGKSAKPDNGLISWGIFGVFNIAQVFETTADKDAVKFRKAQGLGEGKYAALLCDYYEERLPFAEALEKVRTSYRTKFGKPGHYPEMVIVREGGGDGRSLRLALEQYKVPSWPFGTEMTPTMEAQSAAVLVQQGFLWVPESQIAERAGRPRDWAEPMVKQACSYSGKGSIERQTGLECMTQALIHLQYRDTIKAQPKNVEYPDPDEKQSRDEAEAEEIYEREKRGKYSAYGS